MDLVLLLASLALLVAAVVAVRKEPRRTANAVLCGAALVVTFLSGAMGGAASGVAVALVLAVILSPLLVMTLVGALLANGLTMIRPEGRTAASVASGLLGLALIGVVVVCVGLILTGSGVAQAVTVWVMLLVGWIGFLFASMVGYQYLYKVVSGQNQRPDYVVALGSGLVHGGVGRLLGNRVQVASDIVKRWTSKDHTPVLVMSGGQGPDEPRPEAEAMAEYATTELALPDALVLQERASTTTRENLLFTSELVTADERLGPDARGVAVTSNFHVLRTAELARRLGVDVRVAGAPVAWYYWPNAILREFVALLSYHRVGLAVGTLVVTLPLPILIALASTT